MNRQTLLAAGAITALAMSGLSANPTGVYEVKAPPSGKRLDITHFGQGRKRRSGQGGAKASAKKRNKFWAK